MLICKRVRSNGKQCLTPAICGLSVCALHRHFLDAPMTEKEDQVTASQTSRREERYSIVPEEQSLMLSERNNESKVPSDPSSTSTWWDRFWIFVSSGLFFMLFGSLILFFAYSTMSSTHSSFTFVLVVIGVAVLLYGTGTQGAGEFGGNHGGNRYKAVIAGGAGVLAFSIGIGMVAKHAEIREAFQVERKYFRFPLYGQDDGITDLSN
jgi:hypothetical protein